jgi:F-type H+-transporting ATPase subunit b
VDRGFWAPSFDLFVRRESFSMLRQRKWAALFGLLVFCLALCTADSQSPAREVQGHGPAASTEESRLAAAEHVEPQEKINPMQLELGLMVWTIAVFIILLVILGRFAWKPLLAALHSREQHLEHVLLETERARNESEANLAEHRKLMAKAGDEVRAILDKARQEAQATADQLLKQAQSEADLAKQRAQRDIGQARDQALAEIWEKTADMAVGVAGRVLSKQLTDAEHRHLLDAAIKELPAKTTANGHGGKRS